MARFLGLTSRGLIPALADELSGLGIRKVRATGEAAEIECSWVDLYRVHLQTRLATRFLLPVAEFTAYNQDDLYHGVRKGHDFTRHIGPGQTLRVESHVRDHRQLRDQRFVALKVKDALVDQFRDKTGERPEVGEADAADLRVVVRVAGTRVSVALDLTGEPLSHRGYRREMGVAPLRENAAAGMLRVAGWKEPVPLVDPFCGSGTILIEAALAAARIWPTRLNKPFVFQRLRGFQADAWSQVHSEIIQSTRRASPAKPFLFGFDRDSQVLEKARINARAAGVENWILFRQRSIEELTAPPGPPGMIVTNPPYGERMGGDLANLRALWSTLSNTLKREFKGWNAWILCGNPEAAAALKLKAERRVPLWNGPIECRFLHYPLS